MSDPLNTFLVELEKLVILLEKYYGVTESERYFKDPALGALSVLMKSLRTNFIGRRCVPYVCFRPLDADSESEEWAPPYMRYPPHIFEVLTPLVTASIRHFLFYTERLDPTLQRHEALAMSDIHDHKSQANRPHLVALSQSGEEAEISNEARSIAFHYQSPLLLIWDSSGQIILRAKAGLLRPGHVNLLVTCLQTLQERLELECQKLVVMTSGCSLGRSCQPLDHGILAQPRYRLRTVPYQCLFSASKTLVITRKMYFWINQMAGSGGLFTSLLIHPDFRSERLELLLQKYIKEDSGEVGVKVARGIEEIRMTFHATSRTCIDRPGLRIL